MIGIYKITSPTNKIYIGQSLNIERRKNQYKRLDCKRQIPIFNSLKKYGWENHQFEIIKECLSEQLDKLEVYWKQYYIDQLGWDQLLFCGLNDKGGGPKSEKTKEKLRKPKPLGFGENVSKIKTGHICYKNPQRGENISKASKGKLKPKGFGETLSKLLKGKPKSEETKKNMSKPRLKDIIRKGKNIIQYDLQGNFIKEWSSIKEASEGLNIGEGNICLILKQKIKKPKKYNFKYKD